MVNLRCNAVFLEVLGNAGINTRGAVPEIEGSEQRVSCLLVQVALQILIALEGLATNGRRTPNQILVVGRLTLVVGTAILNLVVEALTASPVVFT